MHSWNSESIPIPRRQMPLFAAVVLVAGGAIAGAAALTVLQNRRPGTQSTSGSAPPPPALSSPGSRAGVSGAPQDGYAAVARAVMPAVVNISSFKVIRSYEYSPFLVDPFFRDFFGEQFPGLAVPREQREMS